MKYINEEHLKQMMAEENPAFQQKANVDYLNDEHFGSLLKYYLFLTEYPNSVYNYVPELSEEDLLYNRYYWFVKFTRKYISKNGYDAGMEQQAFELIEEIDRQLEAGVNWSIIEQIGKDCG